VSPLLAEPHMMSKLYAGFLVIALLFATAAVVTASPRRAFAGFGETLVHESDGLASRHVDRELAAAEAMRLLRLLN
jgi:hypothetical protein